MAYKIQSARNHSLQEGGRYFFDANIWITILTSPPNPPYKIRNYIVLFENLLKRDNIKIVVPVVLISEVVNRIIRDVYFLTFAKKNNLDKENIPSHYFKKVFRPSQEYIDSFDIIIDEFRTYSSHIEFVSDGFGIDVSEKQVLSNIDQQFDFNDNFYYQLALTRHYKIVTDDGDFWRENVTIITENKILLDKQVAVNMKIATEEDTSSKQSE